MPFPDAHTEQLIIVDDNDAEIDVGEKLAVHLQGKQHRAFSVFILRKSEEGVEVLLQQRASNKYHSANLWSNTCCGHPRPGENIVHAAKRRLHEEMGFTADLKEIGAFRYCAKLPETNLIENEYDHVLIAFVDEPNINFNTSEVQNCAWISLDELIIDMNLKPEKYSVWFESALKVIISQLI